MRLSVISEKLAGQPMFKVLDEVQKLERSGRKILHFELGEPDFRTPDNITEAGCAALRDGQTHYTSSHGLFAFRETAQQATERSRHFRPSLEQILITPGANAIIYYVIKCVADPGGEILVPDPGFPSYASAAMACGVTPVMVPLHPEKGFVMQPEDVEKHITPRTRLLIVNSPGNPTGAVIPESTMRELYEVAVRHDLFILSDEIYVRLIYNGSPFFSLSMLEQCRERTIVINGFSKAFAMTGWRLGVAIGPERLMEKMTLLNETIVSCVPPFVQYAGIEAVRGDQSAQRKMAEEYRRRSVTLSGLLNDLPGVVCRPPDGAIYVFPDIRETGLDDEAFARFALNEASVAVLPGSCFGPHGKGFVRFSCVSGLETIHAAADQLKAALQKRRLR